MHPRNPLARARAAIASAATTYPRMAAKALRIGLSLSALSLGLLAGAAHAEVVRFNFALDFSSGPLSGQSAFGSFEVQGAECAGFVCNGTFTPAGPANPIFPTGTLNAFSVTVDGITFNAADDDTFPEFPSIELEDNVLARMDFMNFGASTSLSIFGSLLSGWGGEYRDLNFDGSLIANVRQIGDAMAIPEPATLLLVAGALFAGITTSRRTR